MEKTRRRHSLHPLAWIPSLYFAEGIPYVVVMAIAGVMYKRLGMSNIDITLYTSWLYLPWVIKPFWSPFVEMLGTKRNWIVFMQFLVGASLAGVAFTLHLPSYVQWTLAFFWLMAFSSATHDIAADGYYMLELDEHGQTLYVGVRTLFYRLATIAGQGLLIMIAGFLEVYMRGVVKAWSVVLLGTAAFFMLIFIYHKIMLPHPVADVRRICSISRVATDFKETFTSFFRKDGIKMALLFMLLYRLPEALLTKISPLFLLDRIGSGGLGFTTSQVGMVQGTFGVIGLTIGGILGGVAVARDGFGKWLWPMVVSISLPNIVYVFLAYFQTQNLFLVNACIFIEQLGYGFGFTAYMLYMLYFARGASKTAHYAFCTGLMALGMMLPGMIAGWLQTSVGYLNFFIIVMLLCPITFIVAKFVKISPDFGKKKDGA